MQEVANQMRSGAEAAGTAMKTMLSTTTASSSETSSSNPAVHKNILKQRTRDETDTKKRLHKEFDAAEMAGIVPYGLNIVGCGGGATASSMTGRPSGSVRPQTVG